MSLKRILKLLAAFLASQGISLFTQLVVPPIFLRTYPNGLEIYGEWLALTAALASLSSLNYGIQNYANNQTTIHYQRGERDMAKRVQASAFLLVLIVVGMLAVLGSLLFLFPVGRWMGLRHTGNLAAAATLFLMTMQLASYFLFAFLAESYMVIGQAHRGQVWQTVNRLTMVVALAIFAFFRASYPLLAASQFAATALCALGVLIEIRLRTPMLLPSPRLGSRALMVAQLKPSAYFMLLSLAAFLTWQAPLLVIEKVLGPATVAVFSLTRQIFSMSRQILLAATFSIRQEITHLYGQRNWTGLRRLYDLSEKVVLWLTPVSTMGMLLLSPFLFQIWLHKRELFDPATCLLMAAASAVIALKEHKFQFQWSSNRHENLARFNIVAYFSMLVVSVLLMRSMGVAGYLLAWLATELVVAIYIVAQNQKLFPEEMQVSSAPFYRFLVFMAAAVALVAWPVWQGSHWPLVRVCAIAVAGTLVLGLAAYFYFDLHEVRQVLERKLRRRLSPETARPA